jgi:nucleotide-binding universal stress UspA family protein
MKILIAVDDSPHSERAVNFVSRMRWPAGSRVIVVTVVQPVASALAGTYGGGGPDPAGEHKHCEEIVTRAEGVLRAAGFATEGHVAEGGDPRDALVELARSERVDLLIVGSHGRTGLAKLMLGSVSSHIVTHAPCSVLVVKQDAAR